jgi:hypothetical protein
VEVELAGGGDGAIVHVPVEHPSHFRVCQSHFSAGEDSIGHQVMTL